MSFKNLAKLLGILGALSVIPKAFSSDDLFDKYRKAIHHRKHILSAYTPEDLYIRAQAVLKHFGVPAEPDPQPLLKNFDLLQTEQGFKALLPYFDPDSAFSLFETDSESQLQVYQDRIAKKNFDFDLKLRSPDTAALPNSLQQRLSAARDNSAAQPLQGLKILLDPGHMGGDLWDLRTGKYVHDEQGNKLSEGVINLQTALLLEERLRALGAEVVLTRRSLAPVTTQAYDSFDLKGAALDQLREQSLTAWFQSLLTSSPVGSTLYNNFKKNSQFKAIFKEERRADYYNSADLEARVDLINSSQPDISLMIHYDASAPQNDPNALHPIASAAYDYTKVYVPGAFEPTEIESREDRAQLAMHLVDEVPWRMSVKLAHSIIASMQSELNVQADHGSPGGVKVIEQGVFARDLYLLKKHTPSVISYVECLFYNDRKEFAAILKQDNPMTIDGESRPYSDRVAEVADALKDGIVNFVRTGQ